MHDLVFAEPSVKVLIRWIVVFALALVLAPEIAGLLREPARVLAGSDFGAFYCGARVAVDGDDPYRLAPLKACEIQNVYAPGGIRYKTVGIDPAPFPPYYFTVLAPLASLPYETAGMLWHLASIGACAVAVWALATLLRLPWWTVAPAIVLALFTPNFAVGQLPTFIFCLLAVAALLLERGKTVSAAFIAALTVLEPHVALPPLLALFVWRRSARVPLAVVAVVALGLSFAWHGRQLWREYLRDVLPVHAVAEAPVVIQLSASWLLRFFGVDERVATQVGFLQYIVVCGAAVVLAGRIACRLKSPCALLFFPAAAAVSGGSFIHYGQVSIALLFAYLLAVRGPHARFRTAGWIATGLIALPIWEASLARDLPLIVCVVATVVAGVGVRGISRRFIATVATSIVFVALTFLTRRLPPSGPSAASLPNAFAARGYDRTFASTVMGLEWRRNAATVTPSWRSVVAKTPIWIGLVLGLVAGGACGVGLNRASTKTLL